MKLKTKMIMAATLDRPDTSKPYMSPLLFGGAIRHKTNIVLPSSFVGMCSERGYQSTVLVTDVLGRSLTVNW